MGVQIDTDLTLQPISADLRQDGKPLTTKAKATLTECGYDIVDWRYTGATFTAPQRTWKTRLASPLRRAAYALNKDMGVRLLGGETLMLLARAKENRGIVSSDVNSAVSLNRVCE